ncbi:CGNR zinc finger domain-containing protein [Saccharomonospora glauca]|uniref:Conserved protein containing a Zn-ribbon-like motif n=1 Tax=Saccharomonospora glauca K62 TaxID=928724 RepID=I1D3P3_9PSEU|nr:ABATE domain-containing protein [Saccharomonospora glauca]EIE99567.1 conserved protein containing a Zn-ribbon-like motif [Saccharomonospora glauca K62]
MDRRASQFRLDNPVLAFRFTATLVDRSGEAVERLATPSSLATWFELNGFGTPPRELTEGDLLRARELREVIHRIGTATATGGELDPADVERLNEFSVGGAGHLTLEHGRATWCLPPRRWVDSLFGVIADDAVRVLGGQSRTRVRVCARPECHGLFVDTSRAGTRRWCSMNYCGNRQKKQNLRASAR